MSQAELLSFIAEALERVGVEWMLTGSLASSMHGEPRSTHDVDIVVDMTEDNIPVLIREFPEPRFYADAEMMRDAIRNRTMFNVLDQEEGDKIDFWMIGPEVFHRVQFERRLKGSLGPNQIPVISPEDSILSKLHWSKLSGGSERQFRDALRVYEVQRGTLDVEYCIEWASRLGVDDLWQRIERNAEPID